MNSKIFKLIVGIIILGGLGVGLVFKQDLPEPAAHVNTQGEVHEMVTYKSPTCGCCGNWISYMKIKGYKVEAVNTDDLDSIKEQYGVPEQLYSCHTTIVNGGQYFIEGHIVEEAISKLMEEEPQIKGIGMPGMPAASPGMPGTKTAPFDISQVHLNGQISNFVSI